VTRGFLCHRTSRFIERQDDRQRLTSPLRREGTEFRPISWPQALDEIAEKMLAIRAESGPAAILHFRGGGAMGLLKSITDYAFEQFGPVTLKSGDICSGAGEAAQEADFGTCDSHDLFDLLNSRTIVLWGKNPYVSNVHLLPVLKDAKARGARLILIDPVWHQTARLCDSYLQPRPGGDLALALAVARLLFENGWTDPAAPGYCDHWDEFRQLAFSRSVSAWAGLADVPVQACEQLAAQYAQGPSAILIGWGLQRRTYGSTTIRALDALTAISGNLGIPGGGASFYFKRRGAFDTSFVHYLETAPRAIPESLLGEGILAAQDPPIRMVWVTAANPVAMLPQSETIARAFTSRELTVVVDSFLTDTARTAHYVLPTTTLLEDDDLLGAYGHHWLQESRPVVTPPEGVKSDLEIWREMARRLDLDDRLTDDVDTWKRRILARVAPQGIFLETLRERAVRNPLSAPLLFADRQFPTATGRVQLLHAPFPDPPLPTPQRPLFLTALSTSDSQAAQWTGGAPPDPLPATVHPASAQGFADGQIVRIESEWGSMRVRLRYDAKQRTDILLVPKGGWLSRGSCANALIRGQETDAGGCAVYYDTPVCVRSER
jgi:anaerobic selenocysteine-containing dehydrogenase